MYTCELCNCEHDGSYGNSLKYPPKNGKSKYRFCSRVCARAFSTFHKRNEINAKVSDTVRKKYPKISNSEPKSKSVVYVNCIGCNNSVIKNHNIKFCSQLCHSQFMKQENTKKHFNFIEMNGYHKDVRRLKQYIIETKGNVCDICGLGNEWNGSSITLILDHIDGRCGNNSVDNVRLVCPNCDSQLDTYKSKNKNSDRVYRKGVWYQ